MRVFTTTVPGSLTVCVNKQNWEASVHRLALYFKANQGITSESESQIVGYLKGSVPVGVLNLTPAEVKGLRMLKTWFTLNLLDARNASPLYVCSNLNTGKNFACYFQKRKAGGSPLGAL